MATTFSQPGPLDEQSVMLAFAMHRWHKPLHEAEVRIGILMAANEDGDAIKHGGYPVLAKIKPLSLQWRVLASYDALLMIDQREWDDLDEASKAALIDHELSHLELATKELETGTIIVLRDDIGRPKLRSVPGDWNGGDGFAEVVSRHGQAAVEMINARRAFTFAAAACGQLSTEDADEFSEAS